MEITKNYLLRMLSNNDVTFFIPPYQRNYEWEISQCTVFLNDVKKTAISNKKGIIAEHFFGSIVFVQNQAAFGQPNKLVLTDGQQRITTSMLLLVALRDVIEDVNVKNHINSKFLKNENMSGDIEYKIKLKQVETDWEAYKNIILQLELSDENKNSAVYRNYAYFVSELKKIKSEIELVDLLSEGLQKFMIVGIQLEPQKNSWENPQEVFESMNSLGKPLSLADLVRNYLLLGKTPEEQDRLYKDYWFHIEKKLPEQVSNFIRDYMQLKGAINFKKATATNYKELYAEFKKMFKEIDTEDILINLQKYSTYYSYIVLGSSTGNINIDQKLDDLKTLGATIANSFLLGLINSWRQGNFTDNEFIEVLDVIFIYFIRRRIIKLTQGENKVLPTLVKQINEIENADVKRDKMFEIFTKQEHSLRLPNDLEVRDEINKMNFYSFSQSKFILRIIEEKLTKSRPANTNNLQLEHIMPQKLNDVWISELGDNYIEIHQEYLNNIGNITLIRHNQELGNKSFGTKKVTYKSNSGLQVSQNEIINKHKWTKNNINNRAKYLTDLLLEKIFNVPEEYKFNKNYEQVSNKLSFENLDIVGEEINYITDKHIRAKVISDNEVEFEGKKWRLSPLTKEIEVRKKTVSPSRSYSGAQYWEYEGMRLSELR